MSDIDICDPLVCPDGNCPGCQDGNRWCSDPRCAPYCGNCTQMQDNEYVGALVTFIIITCLMVAFFLMWFVYGPSMIHT